jgi:hypothetical protein
LSAAPNEEGFQVDPSAAQSGRDAGHRRQFDRIECAEYDSVVVTPVAQEVEDRETPLIDHDGLAVEETLLRRQVRNRLDDLREAVGEVIAVTRVQPHARAIASRHDAEAIVVDLAYPASAGGRLLGRVGQAWR